MAEYLLGRGTSPHLIKEILGYSSIAITDNYVNELHTMDTDTVMEGIDLGLGL